MHARTEQTQNLEKGVENIRFAHGKRLDGLRELGVTTIRDLLEHYPFRYDDFSQVSKIVSLTMGEKQAALGKIHEAKGRKTAKGGYVYEVSLTDGSGILKAVWFNQRWLADTLTPGKDLMVLGKVEHYGGFLSMSSPEYVVVATQTADDLPPNDRLIDSVDEGVNPVGIVPVYRANSTISSNWIKRLVLESRKLAAEPLDPLPATLRIRHGLVSRQIAWHDIHTPATNEALTAAHRRLAYEQIFWSQLRYAYADRQQWVGYGGFKHQTKGALLTEFKKLLPFDLTASQHEAVEQILADLKNPTRMNRLLLGDVGSGKTVVALHALISAAESGWQATMMAPTEVLAQQYAESLGTYLDSLAISWTLLSSALGTAERQEVRDAIQNGSVQIVFGTHAIIEPEVAFKQLSLIVIDEQHRFGVEHRNALIAKSPAADYLSMTATPIPRSLALVLYGNSKVSYLENRPLRAKTTTTSLDSSVSYKAYEAVKRALGRGEQAYIVCPLISAPQALEDEGERYLDDLDGFYDEPFIAAAEAELEYLRQQVFPEHRIELLTSRVKSEDKQRIMTEFKAAKIDVIVSTTVIEVGVDVPNATVMIILDANRFGLAQLHQLRGRVGRGTKDAHVFFISNNPGEQAKRRLRLLEQNTSGLKLAEADLAERREGDIIGTRQHGAGSLSLINIMRDGALIEAAHADVTALLEKDAELKKPEHAHLLYEIQREGKVHLD